MNEMLNRLGMNAKAAETEMRNLSTNKKNEVLLAVADRLVKDAQTLISANALDVEEGKRNHMPEGLIDRLLLTESRIEGMAEGLRQVSALEDPIGEVLGMKKRPNGLLIGQKRVPLGVIGIIYEARPNVTADAFALCFKTGNVVILKGGSDAIHSNEAIVNCIRETLKEQGVTENAIQLISDTSRETAAEFMKMNQYVDVLIPRGGRGLIKAVVEPTAARAWLPENRPTTIISTALNISCRIPETISGMAKETSLSIMVPLHISISYLFLLNSIAPSSICQHHRKPLPVCCQSI